MLLLTTIRHDTVTGRWLTGFQATWDPKQEGCVIVGSMAQHDGETGQWVTLSPWWRTLVTVCSITAVRPAVAEGIPVEDTRAHES